MSTKTPTKTSTEVRVESEFEIRAGKPVVILTKRTTQVPVTGRGYEYSRSTSTEEITVLSLEDARLFSRAITDALAYAAEGWASNDPNERPSVEDEPRFLVVSNKDRRSILASEWSYREAVAAANRLLAENPSLRYLPIVDGNRVDSDGLPHFYGGVHADGREG